MHLLRAQSGGTSFPVPAGEAGRVALTLDEETVELLIATGFAEVWLAREGHSGKIFINFLNKIELPLVYALYGAMLAGVDGVLVGAGNPEGLPAICSRLADHRAVTRSVSMLYREAGEHFDIALDPAQVAHGRLARSPLKRPAFLAIASLQDLVQALAQSSTEAPDGFIVEHHTAGGHNANPAGPLSETTWGSRSTAGRTSPTSTRSARSESRSGSPADMAAAGDCRAPSKPGPRASRSDRSSL